MARFENPYPHPDPAIADFQRGVDDCRERKQREEDPSPHYLEGYKAWYHAISKIENDFKLLEAERDGIASMLLDVQQESIWLRKALIDTYGEKQSTDVSSCGFGCGMNYGHHEDCPWLAYIGGAKPWEAA